MAHSQQYVSQALKMYTSIQPAVPLPNLYPDVIDVEFREVPNANVRLTEVQRLMTILSHR